MANESLACTSTPATLSLTPHTPSRDEASSLNGVAGGGRILDFPGLQEIDDVSDWIAGGGNREALEVTAGKVRPVTCEDSGEPSMGATDPGCDTAFGEFAWLEAHTLPTRDWVYGRFLSRRTVSVTVAAGGTGKSSLAIVEALAMASGRALLGAEPSGRLKVALWNLEDEYLELQRRIFAACTHHGVTREDIAGRLSVNGAEKPFLLATQDKAGARLLEDNRASIVASLREREIDVLIVDPFVSSHTVQENDNGAIDLVIKGWAGIAREADCAIHLIHHARKVNGGKADVESARGASSLIAAARAARVMNLMSTDEAERYGIGEDRPSRVRVDNGKSNFAPLLDAEMWLKIVSVPLMNGSGFDPEGDRVGVVTLWRPPAATEGITAADLLKCQEAVSIGGPWRKDMQSPQWVGKPIAEALGLDPHRKPDRTKIVKLMKLWIAEGVFQIVEVPDEKRKLRPCVVVGKSAL